MDILRNLGSLVRARAVLVSSLTILLLATLLGVAFAKAAALATAASVLVYAALEWRTVALGIVTLDELALIARESPGTLLRVTGVMPYGEQDMALVTWSLPGASPSEYRGFVAFARGQAPTLGTYDMRGFAECAPLGQLLALDEPVA